MLPKYISRACQCLAIAAGFKFILTGFPVSSENGWYLTTEMRLTVGTVNDDGGGDRGSAPDDAAAAAGCCRARRWLR